MKVIELLNKIANGEEVPKKIKWGCHIFERFVYKYRAIDELGEPDLFQMTDGISEDFLNDEVEIIEDNKKIAELPIIEENELFNIRLTFNQDRRKINELIDEVNKLKENQ